jgi:hypothetical protein
MRAARLFHTVVVMGTSLGTACGGRSVENGSDGANTAGATASANGGTQSVSSPNECRYVSQYHCDSYEPPTHCRCDPSRPQNAAACGGAPKFFCAQAVCGSGSDICLKPTAPNADCHCLAEAPNAPSDCPGGPGQFECNSYSPEFQGCACNPTLPANPTDCSPTDSFECAGYEPSYYGCSCDKTLQSEALCIQGKYCDYGCVSQAPRYGCMCNCEIPIL